MAIRFPVRRPETNEVIHPDDLNKNLSEFVDEINGNIDSDNLETSLNSSRFKANSFTQCYSKSYTSNSNKYRVSRKTIGWTTEDRNGKKMPIIEFIAPSDGWIIIDFNATFRWKGSGILDGDSELSKSLSVQALVFVQLQSLITFFLRGAGLVLCLFQRDGLLPPLFFPSVNPFSVSPPALGRPIYVSEIGLVFSFT